MLGRVNMMDWLCISRSWNGPAIKSLITCIQVRSLELEWICELFVLKSKRYVMISTHLKIRSLSMHFLVHKCIHKIPGKVIQYIILVSSLLCNKWWNIPSMVFGFKILHEFTPWKMPRLGNCTKCHFMSCRIICNMASYHYTNISFYTVLILEVYVSSYCPLNIHFHMKYLFSDHSAVNFSNQFYWKYFIEKMKKQFYIHSISNFTPFSLCGQTLPLYWQKKLRHTKGAFE